MSTILLIALSIIVSGVVTSVALYFERRLSHVEKLKALEAAKEIILKNAHPNLLVAAMEEEEAIPEDVVEAYKSIRKALSSKKLDSEKDDD